MIRRRLIIGIAACVLTTAILATPVGRAAVRALLADAVVVGGRLLRLPCRLLDHDRCFSLDRLDPTCPQCF